MHYRAARITPWRAQLALRDIVQPLAFPANPLPCDVRLVTRPADQRQIPRPGEVRVAAKLFGQSSGALAASLDDGTWQPMTLADDGLWTIEIPEVGTGLHQMRVRCGTAEDRVEFLVRDARHIPKGSIPVALGHARHAIGAWPQAGTEGFQLGPNRKWAADVTARAILTWVIVGLATAGVIIRPWKLPEALWAAGGALLLIFLGLLPTPQALEGIAKGIDVYPFLIGMMLLSEIARRKAFSIAPQQ